MIAQLIESLWFLASIDTALFRGKLENIHTRVERTPCRTDRSVSVPHLELVKLLDLVSIFYPKQVLCLQRSAATVLLLRRYGYDAKMIIGARLVPFRAHAWVELENQVVNDKSYTPSDYLELSRC